LFVLPNNLIQFPYLFGIAFDQSILKFVIIELDFDGIFIIHIKNKFHPDVNAAVKLTQALLCQTNAIQFHQKSICQFAVVAQIKL
jgi:hypothetical protein